MSEFVKSSSAVELAKEQESHQETDSRQRSDQRYQALIQATSQAVWLWDPQGIESDFRGSKRWWEQLTGQTEQEQNATESSWLDVVHPEDRETADRIWKTSISTGTIYDSEYRVRGRNGDWRYIKVRGVPIRNPDQSIREWVGTLDDVTEHREAAKENERLLQMAELKRRDSRN